MHGSIELVQAIPHDSVHVTGLGSFPYSGVYNTITHLTTRISLLCYLSLPDLLKVLQPSGHLI
jgi:hypothetical protein